MKRKINKINKEKHAQNSILHFAVETKTRGSKSKSCHHWKPKTKNNINNIKIEIFR